MSQVQAVPQHLLLGDASASSSSKAGTWQWVRNGSTTRGCQATTRRNGDIGSRAQAEHSRNKNTLSEENFPLQTKQTYLNQLNLFSKGVNPYPPICKEEKQVQSSIKVPEWIKSPAETREALACWRPAVLGSGNCSREAGGSTFPLAAQSGPSAGLSHMWLLQNRFQLLPRTDPALPLAGDSNHRSSDTFAMTLAAPSVWQLFLGAGSELPAPSRRAQVWLWDTPGGLGHLACVCQGTPKHSVYPRARSTTPPTSLPQVTSFLLEQTEA